MSGNPDETKKVCMRLAGLNGNAFALLGAFQARALDQGWTRDEVRAVQDEARAGDYDHLLWTLIKYTVDEGEDDDGGLDFVEDWEECD